MENAWTSGGSLCRVCAVTWGWTSFIIYTALYCTHVHTLCMSPHSSLTWTGCGCERGSLHEHKGWLCVLRVGACWMVCRVSRVGPICHCHWTSCVSVRSAGIFCTLNHKGGKKRSECVNDSWSPFITQVSLQRGGQTLVKHSVHRELAQKRDALTSPALCQGLYIEMCTNPVCVGGL